jgi:hypothetical protein
MMAEDRLNFCGMGVSHGRVLCSPRGATVLYDCRIHAGLCEYLEHQAQTPVVNNTIRLARRNGKVKGVSTFKV